MPCTKIGPFAERICVVLLLCALTGCSRTNAEAQPAVVLAPVEPVVVANPATEPPAPKDPPKVEKAPAFGDSKKVAGEVGDAAGKAGNVIKQKGTHAILEMQASRYVIRLTPEQEKHFYWLTTQVHKDTEALIAVGTNTKIRMASLPDIGEHVESLVKNGEGPPRDVRQKLADLERFNFAFKAVGGLIKFEVYFDGNRGIHMNRGDNDVIWNRQAGLLSRMARDQGPTAGDVLHIIHRLHFIASDIRECEVAERKFHELLLLVYPGDWTNTKTPAVHYGNRELSAARCLREVLDSNSKQFVTSYANAKLLHELYLSNSPEHTFKFEFPPLRPDETERAEQLLSKMKKERQKGPPITFEKLPIDDGKDKGGEK